MDISRKIRRFLLSLLLSISLIYLSPLKKSSALHMKCSRPAGGTDSYPSGSVFFKNQFSLSSRSQFHFFIFTITSNSEHRFIIFF